MHPHEQVGASPPARKQATRVGVFARYAGWGRVWQETFRVGPAKSDPIVGLRPNQALVHVQSHRGLRQWPSHIEERASGGSAMPDRGEVSDGGEP